jgi:hypothetical protein
MAMNGPCLRLPRRCSARDDLLACAALAGDEHRCVGIDDLLHDLSEGDHRRAGADQIVEAARLIERAREELDLSAERSMLRGARHRERERIDLERLGDEVIGSRADRSDRGLETAEGGDDDDRKILASGDDPLTQLESVHRAHVEIGDHAVERLRLRQGEGVGGRHTRHAVEALLAQTAHDQIAHRGVVVDDEHAPAHAAAGRKMKKLVPRPTSLSTVMRPPCSSTMP